MTTQFGVPALLPYIFKFYAVTHNLIICCDYTMFFGMIISNGLFDFSNTVKVTIRYIKAKLDRNLKAIFTNDDTNDGARMKFTRFSENDHLKVGLS